MADYKKGDFWNQKAKKEGYPARSVYKLMEIDEKFGLFKNIPVPSSKNVPYVLDLGAAPGSWSLYVLRKKRCFLSAADLSPLSREYDKGLFDSDNPNFFFLQGDITNAETRNTLFEKGPYSVIISDAAPATTGNRIVDTARSLELAEIALSYAEEALLSGGNLVFKIFQNAESAGLLKKMKILFNTAKSYKPQSCRGESVETFFIGLGRRSN